jgi:hypothetical protein
MPEIDPASGTDGANGKEAKMDLFQNMMSALLSLKEAGKSVFSFGAALAFLVAATKLNGDKLPMVALFVLTPIFIGLGYLLSIAFQGQAPVEFAAGTSGYVKFWVPVLVHILMVYFVILSAVVVCSLVSGFPLPELKIHPPA